MHGGNEKREIEAEGVGVCVKGVSKQEQEREGEALKGMSKPSVKVRCFL